MNKIAPAFVAAKKAFGPALKDKSNPAFKSKYADLGACLDAVEDALLANGIALYHESTEDPNGITIECILLHESGETIKGGKLHVPAVKHDAPGFGSAMTYARRYSVMAVCGIAPEDDDGNAAAAAAKPKAREQAPAKGVAAQGIGTTLEDAVKDIVAGVKKGDAKGAAAYLATLKEPALQKLWEKIPEDVQDELTVNWPEVAA
jgi:hypothetical protein